MNEEHIISAILTAGLVARKTDDELAPKDVITLYEMILSSYLASLRPGKV